MDNLKATANQSNIKNTYTIITAICMFIASALSITFAYRNIDYFFEILDSFYYGFFEVAKQCIHSIGYVFLVVGFIISGITLIVKKLEQYKTFAPLIIVASYILLAISGVTLYYFPSWLYAILNLLTAVIWALYLLPKFKAINLNVTIKKIYLIVASIVVLVITLFVIIFIDYGYLYGSILIPTIVEYLALIFFGLSMDDTNNIEVRRSEKMNTQNTGNYNYQQNQQQYQYQSNINSTIEPEGFTKVWIVVVLTIVTLGIYGFIWIYQTVGTLNKKLPMSQQFGQGAQVLLCIFVPFYVIYWVYKHCKRIEEYSLRIGTGSNDLSLIGLLLTIFGFGIIAYALMQDQINKNIMFEENGGITNSPQMNLQTQYYNVNTPHKSEPVTPQPVVNSTYVTGDKKKSTADEIQYLRELKSLYDEGILTEEEFNFKKNEILR